MDKIVIKGGRKLQGEVNISGAKNAALPILAATIINPGVSILKNIPRLKDIENMIEILEMLGAKCDWLDSSTLLVDAKDINNYVAPYELVRKMRASICILGPLVGRFGRAKVSLPGGCVIGPRPIDLHIKGLRDLGVAIKIEHGYVHAEANKITGGDIFIGGRYGSSVLATANLICASVYAEGKTIIEPASMEPEIVDLIKYLKSIGAKIEGEGSSTIRIEGVKSFHESTHELIPDRIEAGTYLIAGLISNGKVFVKGARKEHLRCLIDSLRAIGANIKSCSQGIEIAGREKLKSIDIVTHPYPGFPTDLQAQTMSLLAIADGISVITEKIYPERYMHISELNRFGADISLEGSTAIVKGVKKLSGAPVMASDLRASVALILAALVAEGETEILRVYHLDRGYENIDKKLSSLGAEINRMADNDKSSLLNLADMEKAGV